MYLPRHIISGEQSIWVTIAVFVVISGNLANLPCSTMHYIGSVVLGWSPEASTAYVTSENFDCERYIFGDFRRDVFSCMWVTGPPLIVLSRRADRRRCRVWCIWSHNKRNASANTAISYCCTHLFVSSIVARQSLTAARSSSVASSS